MLSVLVRTGRRSTAAESAEVLGSVPMIASGPSAGTVAALAYATMDATNTSAKSAKILLPTPVLDSMVSCPLSASLLLNWLTCSRVPRPQ